MSKVQIDTLCVSLDYMNNEAEVVFALFVDGAIVKSFAKCFSCEAIDAVVIGAVKSLLNNVTTKLIAIRKTGNRCDDLIALSLQGGGRVLHYLCSSHEIIETVKLHTRSVELYDDKPRGLRSVPDFGLIPHIPLFDSDWIGEHEKVLCISTLELKRGHYDKAYDTLFTMWSKEKLESAVCKRSSIADGCIMYEVQKLRDDYPDWIVLDIGTVDVDRIGPALERMIEHTSHKGVLVVAMAGSREIVEYTRGLLQM